MPFVPVNPLLAPGEYPGTCVGARQATSAAGNLMVVWTFDCAGRLLSQYTLRRRAETAETAAALGLGKKFRLSSAVGRQAILVVGVDGKFNSIERVRPL